LSWREGRRWNVAPHSSVLAGCRALGVVVLREEQSKSRKGIHMKRCIALVFDSNGNMLKPRVRLRETVKPTYSKGHAYLLHVEVPDNAYAVQACFTRNWRGMVKGFIEVYDSSGALLFRAVYRKLKLRYSKGDPAYAWLARLAASVLKLPVKRENLAPPTKTR